MNIEFLQSSIDLFETEVLESGFKRDLEDYASSISSSQNNILQLREIANRLLVALEHIYATDLPEYLKILLPPSGEQPFTKEPHNSTLRAIINNTEIQQADFYNKLNQFIANLKAKVEGNVNAIQKIEKFIAPYVTTEKQRLAKSDLATIAIKFIDLQTITSLKQFSRTLNAWNRVIPIYHQLIKSESPDDIEIVEVQNGSIDVIINLSVEVAVDLVEVCAIGFGAFWAYLKYKREAKPIVDTYHGNPKLLKLEEEKEGLLLENIHDAIKKCIEDQHQEAKKRDGNVNTTAVPKKVEQVAKLIASHITKGNDIKLLAYPEDKTKEAKAETQELFDTLLEKSSDARREFRLLPGDVKQELLETYGEIPEGD